MEQIIVPKGRTVILPVSLGYDASADTFVSQIRDGKDPESTLIATWSISFESDGQDGELVFTLDNSVTSEIENYIGYMDIKRVTGGEPVSVFDGYLEVLFKDVVSV